MFAAAGAGGLLRRRYKTTFFCSNCKQRNRFVSLCCFNIIFDGNDVKELYFIDELSNIIFLFLYYSSQKVILYSIQHKIGKDFLGHRYSTYVPESCPIFKAYQL